MELRNHEVLGLAGFQAEFLPVEFQVPEAVCFIGLAGDFHDRGFCRFEKRSIKSVLRKTRIPEAIFSRSSVGTFHDSSMAARLRKTWTRDQLLIVLNLYHKVRFGQIDSRLPVIIDLAEKLGRTPASVLMKLGNLASFDPVLQLKGKKGLTGASRLDRDTWDEYHANPVDLVPLAQEMFDALFVSDEDETTEVVPATGIVIIRRPPPGDTETTAISKARRGQDYFRDVVLNNYGSRCGITGLPVRELLIASHIVPWSSDKAERLNVRNGIALNRLHDTAFDRHLVSFDDELRLILSPTLKSYLSAESVSYHFKIYEGRILDVPEDGIPPDLSLLERHRRKLAR